MRGPRTAIALAILAALLLAPATLAAQEEQAPPAAPPTPPTLFSSKRVIVEWAPGVNHADRVDARSDAKVDFHSDLGNRAFQLVEVQPGQTARDAIRELRADPAVVLAERDSFSTPNAIPNDPLFGQLWGLRNMGLGIGGFAGAVAGDDVNAVAAWNRAAGTPSTVIADLDSGYRFEYSDLASVAWTNPEEIAGNGVDDDGNGIVDDVHGADFVGSNADAPISPPDGDPTDDNLISGGHGVHTAGTMGASGNNGVGITGVSRNVRIMPLRVCSNSSVAENEARCPTSSQVAAINYAAAKKARVANMSLGGTSFSQTVVNAIAAAKETLFVISAGNDAVDNEVTHHYPCDYTPQTQASPPVAEAVDNIVCVAATDQADGLASFSDWGATSVDLGAPGTETLSTFPAIEESFYDSFETSNFSTTWSQSGTTNFGRAGAGDGPLTSFGMTDSPGAAPAASTQYDTTLTTGVAIPAGSGACTLRGRRYRNGGTGGTFYYQVLSDGIPVFTNTASTTTAGSALVSFNTVPILGLAGHSIKLRFGFTSGPSPTAANGIWFDDLKITCYEPISAPLDYAFLQGTSMAAPHVTGAAGLLFSMKPAATVTEVKNALLTSVDLVASLTGKTTTGGRLDVAAALNTLVPVGTETVAPDTAVTSGPEGSTADTAALFQFSRTDADTGAFECKLDAAPAWSPCTSPAPYTVAVGPHTFEVRAKGPSGLVDPTPASRSWTVAPAPPPQPEVIVDPLHPLPSPAPPPPPPLAPSCTVPKLAGKTLGQAKAALAAAGCKLGVVAKPKAKKGRRSAALIVKSSSPAARAKPANGTVNLTLGPKPKPKRHHH